MTLLDRRPDTDAPSGQTPAQRPPGWLPWSLGAGAAAASLALVVAPVMLLWASDSRSSGTWQQALGVGAASWLASVGWQFRLGGSTLSFVPLLLTVLPVVALAWSWTWLLRRRPADEESYVGETVSVGVLRLLGLWFTGYAVVLAAAVGLTFLGPARPDWPWLPVALLAAPLLGVAVGTWRVARDDDRLLGMRLDGSMLPDWFRRAVGPALRGVGALLALGLLVVAGAVALHWGDVRAVQGAVGSSPAAEVGLDLIQFLALPNLALWAVSFLAGPGFSVVQGASVTWSGASSGLMPLIPVLAAHPQPGAFPWFVPLLALLPIGVGALIGRWSLRAVARLSSLTMKFSVAVSAAALTTAMTALLDVVGGSSLGAYRLADIGAPAGWLALVLAVELSVGAVIVVLHDAWRLRR